MYLGAFCSTALMLSAYVAFAESSPTPEFRHMVPARFYFFIPFFALWSLAIGTVAELFWFQKRASPLRGHSAWFLLGLAYSLVWLAFGLTSVLQSSYVFPLSYVVAFVSAYLLHTVCGSDAPHAA
jgi:hypothetical protein